MAIRLNGSGQYLSRAAALPSPESFTLCGVARVNTNRGGVYHPIIGASPEAVLNYNWRMPSTNAQRHGSFDGSTNRWVQYTNRAALGAWFFFYLRGVGDGADQLQGGWMNFGDTAFAEERASQLANGSIVLSLLALGRDVYGGEWLAGDFCSIGLWDHGLTGAELLAEAASPRRVKTSGLLIDAPMNAATVEDAVLDLSGNDYHWTAHGSLAVVAGPAYARPRAWGAVIG
jgi:hypothetical protein